MASKDLILRCSLRALRSSRRRQTETVRLTSKHIAQTRLTRFERSFSVTRIFGRRFFARFDAAGRCGDDIFFGCDEYRGKLQNGKSREGQVERRGSVLIT